MAIYYLNASKGSRSTGQSAAAKFQYITRSGRYAAGHAEIVTTMSGNLPCWAGGPAAFWAAADQHERANGRLFRSYVISLPRELGPPEWEALAKSLASQICGKDRLPWSAAIHAGDGANPHLHLVINERVDDGIARDGPGWFRRAALAGDDPASGGARKTQRLEKKKFLYELRKSWASLANTALAEASETARIDHRTLEAQRQEAEAAGDHDAAAELDRLPVHQPRASIALEDADPDERPGTMPRRRRRRRRPAATGPGRRARQTRRGNDQHRRLQEETRQQAQRMAARAAELRAQARNLEAELAAQQEAARIAAAEAARRAQQQKEDEEYRAWLARLPQKLARLRDAGRYRGPDAPSELHIVSHPVFIAPVARAQGEAAGVIDRAAMDDEAPHLVGRWMRWLGRVTEPCFTPPGEREERVLLDALEDRRAAGLEVARDEPESLALVPADWQAEAIMASSSAAAAPLAVLTFGQVAQAADLLRLAWRVDPLLLPFPEADQPQALREAIAGRWRWRHWLDRERAVALRPAVLQAAKEREGRRIAQGQEKLDRLASRHQAQQARLAADMVARDEWGATPLHAAARSGAAGEIDRLLEFGADPNARDGSLSTLLHWAMRRRGDAAEVAARLLDAGADVHARDEWGQTPLLLAASNGAAAAAAKLIAAGADVNARNDEGKTPLAGAAGGRGAADIITTLAQAGANLQARDNEGRTPMHAAAMRILGVDAGLAIRTLAQAGADVHARDKDGMTPLHVAAMTGSRAEASRALIELGADVHARDGLGHAPLHLAARHGDAEVSATLIEAGADPAVRNDAGETPLDLAWRRSWGSKVDKVLAQALVGRRDEDDNTALHLAMWNANPGEVVCLLEAGADLNARNKWGQTPLHLAARTGNADEITRLARLGAELDATDAEGLTPLDWAAREDHPKVAARLARLGADLNGGKFRGYASLHWAAAHASPEMITALIDAGADLHARDEQGWTPLHLAARSGRAEVSAALIEAGADPEAKGRDGETPLALARRLVRDGGVVKMLEAAVAQSRPPPAGLDTAAGDTNSRTPPETVQRKDNDKSAGALPELDGQPASQPAIDRLDPPPPQPTRTPPPPQPTRTPPPPQPTRTPPPARPTTPVPAPARQPAFATPMHEAAAVGDHVRLTELVIQGADVHATDKAGQLPLHLAATAGHAEAAATLIELGADPNAADKQGRTPLHAAAEWSPNPETIRKLIELGADVHARNEHGRTALHRAASQNRDPEAITTLIEAGAELEARDKQGWTPLHHAAEQNDNPAMIARLLHHGAELEARSKFGSTPLHVAAKWGKPAVIRALLEARADPNAVDKVGNTPLALARHEGNTAAIKALEEAAANPADAGGLFGSTPDPKPDTASTPSM